MENKNSGVCVISLEGIDLNFLETRYKANYANIIPEWSENVLELNKNKYFEFEVRQEEKLGDCEDKIKHLEYTTCHICASQVPKLFFTEHASSVKHKINTKIANLAVQRLQKNIINNEEINKDEIKSFTYFCPVCVTVMDWKDKNSHELSIGHKNTLIVEKFLKDFLNLYSNDEYDIVEDQSTKYNDTNCKIQKDNLKCQLKVSLKENLERYVGIKDYITLIHKKYKISPMFLKAVDNEFLEIETVDGSVVKVDYQSFHGFRQIGSGFTECTLCKEVFEIQSMKSHIMNDNHMRLVTLPLKNKHCIREVNISWGHCVLCNLAIENTSVHELCNLDHSTNLSKFLISEKSDESHPIKEDKKTHTIYYEGVKQGDEANDKNEYNCNAFVNKDVTGVNQNSCDENCDINNQNLNLQGFRDLNNASSSNQYKHFCNTCNVSISSNQNMKKHLKSPRHLLHLKSDLHYLMKEGETQDALCCRVCEENVNNTVFDVKSHVTSMEHSKRYEALLSSNCIKKIASDRFYCTKCNEVLFVKTEIYHLRNKHIEVNDSHKDMEQNKISDNIQKPISRENVSSFYFCDLCHLNVPNNISNIESHLLGRRHAIKMLEKESTTTKYGNVSNKVENTVKVTKKDNLILTNYDGVKKSENMNVVSTITHNIENTNNISSTNRNLSFGEALSVTSIKNNDETNSILIPIETNVNEAIPNNEKKHFCTTCNVSISNNRNMKKHSKSPKHLFHLKSDFHYLMKEGESLDYLICRICDKNVNNTVIDVKNHVDSVEHANRYETLLNSNTIKKMSEDRFLCKNCNEVLFVKTEIYHIHAKHRELNGSPNDVYQNENTDKVQNSVLKAVIPPNVYFCDICNVKVPNTKTNIEIHILGRPHQTKVKEMFEKEKIPTNKENVLRKDNLTCKIVKTHVSETDDDHVTKKDVYYNLVKSNLAGTVKCLVCDVYLTDNESNILTHIKGINHVNNYEFITKTNKLEIDGNNVYCAICSTNISIGNEVSHCRGKKHLKNVADAQNESG